LALRDLFGAAAPEHGAPHVEPNPRSVIDEIGSLAHGRIEPQTFVRAPPIFMAAWNLYAHHHLVRVDFANNPLLGGPVEFDSVADF